MAKIPLALRREWNRKLAESGFSDLEDENGRLKREGARADVMEHGKVTLAAEFFALFSHYLDHQNLTRLERRILELYCEGLKIDAIAHDVYRSRAYVKAKIYFHRDRILHKGKA